CGNAGTRGPLMTALERKTSRPGEPERSHQEVHSPAATLPEGDVGFCGLDTVPQVALRRFDAPEEDATRGAPPCAPALLGCCRVAQAPRRASATWRASPWGGRSARPGAPAALVARGPWTPAPRGACRGCGWLVRPGGCHWATARPRGQKSRGMRRGPPPGALALGARQPTACAQPWRPG